MLASELVHRVAEATRIKDFHSDSMDADYFKRIFQIVKDVLRSLNQQADVTFGFDIRDVQVNGNTLTFKPYTTAEQAIIDGGGSVDITDRIVDILPTACPVIHFDNCKLGMVDATEISAYLNDFMAFCWLPSTASDVIRFGGTVSNTLTLTIKKPIAIPVEPTDEVDVPDRCYEFVISSISQRVAATLGFMDRAKAMAEVASAERLAVVKNNSPKPMRMYPQISRFD